MLPARKYIYLYIYIGKQKLPGHAWVLQCLDSSAGPIVEQFVPPNRGDGLLHCLLRF